MIPSLLKKITTYLQAFLNTYLPTISDNWWVECVLKELSMQQQNEIDARHISSLNNLDLAALLRVFEKNWGIISFKATLKRNGLSKIHELKEIRNKYAHSDGTEPEIDAVLKDLFIIEDFLNLIGVSDSTMSQIHTYKDEIMFEKYRNSNKVESLAVIEPASPATKFKSGDIVYQKSRPEIKGAVIAVIENATENRYTVFIEGKPSNFYESQLDKEEVVSETLSHISLDEFNAHISALQIINPNISSLYSLNSAFIDFVPYQYRPVMKIINADRPRILIADEVGIGKTIEAGLILRELQARQEINSVLIICPKPLVTEKKWLQELKRFNEEFVHIDGRTLDYCVAEMNRDGVWPAMYNKAIVPFSILDSALYDGSTKPRRVGLKDLDPPPTFDLVIVDEAHRIRNSSTQVHQVVKYFCDNAEAVVFLSATPIQLGENDLYTLLNVLRPDYILDNDSYKAIAEPNQYINRVVELIRNEPDNWKNEVQEQLNLAKNTFWGNTFYSSNPDFEKTIAILSQEILDTTDKVSLIRHAEQLHTLSGIINRTRRRDIGEFTTRNATAIEVPFTDEQLEFYRSVIDLQRTILESTHSRVNIQFMMSMLLRQTSSCLYGLIPFIENMINRTLSELDEMEISEDSIYSPIEFSEHILSKIDNLRFQISVMNSDDPKYNALYKIIEEKSTLKNKKILIFSSFRHTIFYLAKKFQEKGLRYGLIYGDVVDSDRLTVRERFALPSSDSDAIDILISSEVGSEGLDYQFCDAIVNYDLPWNPMRIEQRIGRIDRYGQESPAIAIYNFITPETIDYDIYYRCLNRIGVFTSAIGGCEEILGNIAKAIQNIAEDFSLTKDQQIARLNILAENAVRESQENEKLEQEQKHLFSVNLPNEWINKEIEDATNYWLMPNSLQNLIHKYLNKRLDKHISFSNNPIKSIRLSQEDRKLLLDDLSSLNLAKSPILRDWENWLKGNEPQLSLTFDSALVKGDRKIHLISPVHPLAKQASKYYDLQQPVVTCISLSDNSLPIGEFPFAINMWTKQGLKNDVLFQPICENEEVSKNFIRILKSGISVNDNRYSSLIDAQSLDNIHYTKWEQANKEHKEYINKLVENKKNSLAINHKNRIRIIDKEIENSTNEKITKMKDAQKHNAERDFEKRIAALEQSKSQADIKFETIAYGVIINSRG